MQLLGGVDKEHISLAIGLVALLLSVYKALNIRENERRISTLEVKIGLFWDALAKDAARILHSPDPALARRDYLLEQFIAEKITRDELAELIKLLNMVVHTHGEDVGARLAASRMLIAIEMRYN